MDFLFNLYKWVIIVLGNFSLFVIIVYLITKIREKIIMKISTKKFAKELMKNKFIDESIGKITPEEQEDIKNKKYKETKITLNLNDMSVTKERK